MQSVLIAHQHPGDFNWISTANEEVQRGHCPGCKETAYCQQKPQSMCHTDSLTASLFLKPGSTLVQSSCCCILHRQPTC